MFGRTTISRPSRYPRAHALHLCASVCLEGKRLGCRKDSQEESQRRSNKDEVNGPAKLEVVEVGTQSKYMLLLLGKRTNAHML